MISSYRKAYGSIGDQYHLKFEKPQTDMAGSRMPAEEAEKAASRAVRYMLATAAEGVQDTVIVKAMKDPLTQASGRGYTVGQKEDILNRAARHLKYIFGLDFIEVERTYFVVNRIKVDQHLLLLKHVHTPLHECTCVRACMRMCDRNNVIAL
eukprot:GHVU01040479.1.p1 GENE.GHVU01040479.1~~GHVU01040479.1.p1  ORF type:complete len:152 (-),score=22.06 GHVU01040479.1:830-1285(-)